MINVSKAELKSKVIKFGTYTLYILALKIFLLVKVHKLINNVLNPVRYQNRVEFEYHFELNLLFH